MSMTIDEMSARYVDPEMKAAGEKVPSFLVSADGHVDEPADMFNELPPSILDRMTRPKVQPDTRPKGGSDPAVRITDMDIDGVAAEVLYPTFTLGLFASEPDVQEAAFRVYNDWIADFCNTSPKRLFAIPCISVYDIDGAIKEMHRCNDMGLKGALVWQVPDPKLPLTSPHYEKLWAAAAEMDYPLNFHILTGFNYFREKRAGMEKVRGSVNIKTSEVVTTVFDLIWSGVFERHPKLTVEIVEGEIGWIPFILQQWDYYFERHRDSYPIPIDRKPSEIFAEHVYGTFLEDYVGTRFLSWWGEKNCMWSNDYPHFNMTFPQSRQVVEHHLKDLSAEQHRRYTWDNAMDLFQLELTEEDRIN